MLDMSKYELVPMLLPNIKGRWEIGKDRNGYAFAVEGKLKPLVTEAAMKFPMWDFVGSNATVDRDKCAIFYRTFKVYANRELLGEISWTYNSKYEVLYTLTNERIKEKRERGSILKTKDLKKALKTLAKEFGVKTIDERMNEAKNMCYHMLSGSAYDTSNKFRGNFRSLFEKIMESLMDDWQTVRRLGEAKGADLTLLDKLPSEYETYKIAKDMQECFSQEKGAVVIIHGSDYVVSEKDVSKKVYGTDTLPEWVKRGIGMLKLVEPGNMIANIGCKLTNTSFFVIKRDT